MDELRVYLGDGIIKAWRLVTEDGVKKDLCFWFFLLVAYGVIEEGGCLESRDE